MDDGCAQARQPHQLRPCRRAGGVWSPAGAPAMHDPVAAWRASRARPRASAACSTQSFALGGGHAPSVSVVSLIDSCPSCWRTRRGSLARGLFSSTMPRSPSARTAPSGRRSRSARSGRRAARTAPAVPRQNRSGAPSDERGGDGERKAVVKSEYDDEPVADGARRGGSKTTDKPERTPRGAFGPPDAGPYTAARHS